jgi:hypothetical protein
VKSGFFRLRWYDGFAVSGPSAGGVRLGWCASVVSCFAGSRPWGYCLGARTPVYGLWCQLRGSTGACLLEIAVFCVLRSPVVSVLGITAGGAVLHSRLSLRRVCLGIK